MSNINLPTGSFLNEIYAVEACSMEKIAAKNQLNKLKIEYKILHDREHNEITLMIPGEYNGDLRITPHQEGVLKNRRFFRNSPPKEMRLPGGKVLKSEAKEMVHAVVNFISSGEHENATFIISEPNFAELIDTAIECLAQIDSVYFQPVPKKRPPRRGKPSRPDSK